MSLLSKHTATVELEDGTKFAPIAIDVTLDETWSPYCQATITAPTEYITDDVDPRLNYRIKIKLQQDFGELLYVHELTTDFGGDVSNITAAYTPVSCRAISQTYTKPWNIFEPASPISKITAAYAGDVSDLTAAGFYDVSFVSGFLHEAGAFNPVSSTVFEGTLGVRSVEYDYITKQAVITAASDEALAQDRFGYGSDVPFTFETLRGAISYMLNWANSGQLDPYSGDYIFQQLYQVEDYFTNASHNLWDDMNALAQSCGFSLWSDENDVWRLEENYLVEGEILLKDDDNITSFRRKVSRDEKWYSNVNIEYALETLDQASDPTIPFGAKRYLYLDRKESTTVEPFGAASILARAKTRAETYTIEAISNYNARPRQALTIDIAGEPTKTGVVQAVSWSLPADRMSIDIRDLQEV